jgi:hypothetical protein
VRRAMQTGAVQPRLDGGEQHAQRAALAHEFTAPSRRTKVVSTSSMIRTRFSCLRLSFMGSSSRLGMSRVHRGLKVRAMYCPMNARLQRLKLTDSISLGLPTQIFLLFGA